MSNLYLIDLSADEWSSFQGPDLPIMAESDREAKTITRAILRGHASRHGDFMWKCDLKRFIEFKGQDRSNHNFWPIISKGVLGRNGQITWTNPTDV